jgi:hypothetical protein
MSLLYLHSNLSGLTYTNIMCRMYGVPAAVNTLIILGTYRTMCGLLQMQQWVCSNMGALLAHSTAYFTEKGKQCIAIVVVPGAHW